MIQVEHLTRSYGSTRAVDDVCFNIGPGEIVGLLGHNGAGKTTIMKMLTGFLEPSQGKITINGMDLETNRRAIGALIGYLPENCPVYPEMSVVSYLEYMATLHQVASPDLGPLLRQTLKRTGLTERATQSIGTLSRGYRQRLGVAQAILHRPKIIILDEPTNGLDPTQIQQMRTLLRELSQEATLIISTHILQEVQAVCDRVIIIGHGKKMLDTSLDALSENQRLLVTTDREEAGAVLSNLEGVSSVEQSELVADRYRYALSTSRPARDLAPGVAAAITGKGWPLFELTLESRSLERIFSEINLAAGREQ